MPLEQSGDVAAVEERACHQEVEERRQAEERRNTPGHSDVDQRHRIRGERAGGALDVRRRDRERKVGRQDEDEDHLDQVREASDDIESAQAAHLLGNLRAEFDGDGHGASVEVEGRSGTGAR